MELKKNLFVVFHDWLLFLNLVQPCFNLDEGKEPSLLIYLIFPFLSGGSGQVPPWIMPAVGSTCFSAL